MKPRLVEKPAFHVVGLSGRFTPETTKDIPRLWGRFAPVMATVPGRTRMDTSYGMCLDDEKGERGAPALEYTACVEVKSLAAVPKGMVGFTVPAGTYAVFTHTGPISEIGKTWDAIHHEWLRAAGLEKGAGPDYEAYDPRWDARTGTGPVDIYVPVRKAR